MKLTTYINNIKEIYWKLNSKWAYIYRVKNRKEAIKSSNTLEPISDKELIRLLVIYLLGPDYYITDPVSNDQGNAIILEDIVKKYK